MDINSLAFRKITPPESQLFIAFNKTTTSAPILFHTLTGDPVTPLSSAFRMSNFFEGSVVLTSDAPGHGFNNALSKCTMGYLQAYLKNATLPPVGTVCKSDAKPADYFPTVEKLINTDPKYSFLKDFKA